MTESFRTAVKQLGDFTSSELKALEAVLVPKTLNKGEFLLQSGNICDAICFILSGAFTHFADDEQGPEYIGLYLKNNWVFDHMSFTTRSPSKNNIQAYAESQILIISLETAHYLIGRSQVYLQLGKLLGASNHRNTLIHSLKKPDDRYKQLLETQPDIVKVFPQKLIASYLGITPETLSRVRSRIR